MARKLGLNMDRTKMGIDLQGERDYQAAKDLNLEVRGTTAWVPKENAETALRQIKEESSRLRTLS